MVWGIALALGTSAFWALGNVFVARSGRAVGSWRALLYSQLLGALLTGALSLLFDAPNRTFDGPAALWLAAAGLGSLLAYVTMFYAFAHAPLSLAVPFMASWPVIATVIGIAAFGERPGGAKLLAAGVVIAGVLVVARGARAESEAAPTPASTKRAGALLAALAAGVGFGVAVPAISQLGPSLGEFGASAATYAVTAALGFAVAVAARAGVAPPPWRALPVVLGTAATEAAGFVSVTMARRFAPLAVIAPLASLASTLTMLVAWFALGERPSRVAVIGAALVCVGVVLFSL